MILSHDLAYTDLAAYTRLIESLPAGGIYDRSPHAVGYQQQVVTFSLTDAGTGPWEVYRNGNLDQVVYSETFQVSLDHGYNEFHAIGAEGRSNVVIIHAYLVHFFLALYALEYSELTQDRVEAVQASSREHETYEEDGYSGDTSIADLETHFGDMLGIKMPERLTREEYPDFLKTVYDAYGLGAVKGMRLSIKGYSGTDPVIIPHRDVLGFKIGTRPLYINGSDVAWNRRTVYLYGRYYVLPAGSQNFGAAYDKWFYVDGERGPGGGLVMQTADEFPHTSEVTEVEVFGTDQIKTDDTSGTVTGYPESRYVTPTYYPQSLVSVASTGTAGVGSAYLSGQHIALGTVVETAQVGVITATYKRMSEFKYLGRVRKVAGSDPEIYSGRIGRGAIIRSDRYRRYAMKVIVRGASSMSDKDKAVVNSLVHGLKPAQTLVYLFFED